MTTEGPWPQRAPGEGVFADVTAESLSGQQEAGSSCSFSCPPRQGAQASSPPSKTREGKERRGCPRVPAGHAGLASWASRTCHCQLLLPSALGHWAWPGLIICVLSCIVTLCASVLNEDEGCPPWGSGNSLPTKQGLWWIARWGLCISGSVPSTPCPALQLPEDKAVDSLSV